MKKNLFLGLTFLLSIILYCYTQRDMTNYIKIKYLFPQQAIQQCFSVVFIVITVLYYYYAIHQYYDIKNMATARVGKIGFYKKITGVYAIHYLYWIVLNVFIDLILGAGLAVFKPLIITMLISMSFIVLHIKINEKTLTLLAIILFIIRIFLSYIMN